MSSYIVTFRCTAPEVLGKVITSADQLGAEFISVTAEAEKKEALIGEKWVSTELMFKKAELPPAPVVRKVKTSKKRFYDPEGKSGANVIAEILQKTARDKPMSRGVLRQYFVDHGYKYNSFEAAISKAVHSGLIKTEKRTEAGQQLTYAPAD